MKPRTCFSERTPPLKPLHQFGAPPADSPALRRLISFGLGALALWGCWQLVAHQSPRRGFISSTSTSAITAPQSQAPLSEGPAIPPKPPLAHVERALPVTKRALPVYGAHYPATLPDGQQILATWKGTRALFSQLPKRPALGDEFGVKEGQGVSWIWATPYGWNHPVWIDP